MMDWSDLILVDLVFDICFVVYSNYLGFLAMWIKTQVYLHTYLKKTVLKSDLFNLLLVCLMWKILRLTE